MATEINLNGKPIANIWATPSSIPDSEKAIINIMSRDEIVSHAIKNCSRIVLAFDPSMETKEKLVFPTEILEQNDYTYTTFAVDSDKVVVMENLVQCNLRYQGNRIDVAIPMEALHKVEYITVADETCVILFEDDEATTWDPEIGKRMYQKHLQKEMAKSMLERKMMSMSKSKHKQARPTETKFFLFRK